MLLQLDCWNLNKETIFFPLICPSPIIPTMCLEPQTCPSRSLLNENVEQSIDWGEKRNRDWNSHVIFRKHWLLKMLIKGE